MSNATFLGRMGMVFDHQNFGVDGAPGEITPETWKTCVMSLAENFARCAHNPGYNDAPPVFPQLVDAMRAGKLVKVEIKVHVIDRLEV